LQAQDTKVLDALVHRGVQPVLSRTSADRAASAPTVAAAVRLSPEAVRNIAQRNRTQGLDAALYEWLRPGVAEVLAPAYRTDAAAGRCAPSTITGFSECTVR
jgi:hypothetical protein